MNNEQMLHVINCWIASASIEEGTVDPRMLYNYIKEARNILMTPNIPSHDVSNANINLLTYIRRNQ